MIIILLKTTHEKRIILLNKTDKIEWCTCINILFYFFSLTQKDQQRHAQLIETKPLLSMLMTTSICKLIFTKDE